MRLMRITLVAALTSFAAGPLRAEYIVLKNGQRFHVTGYQLQGDKYQLQFNGGTVLVAVDDVSSIEPEDTFAALPPPPAPTAPYGDLVKAAAARYAVDEELINSVIAAESNFDPKAVSKKNACGLMQLLPETAAHFGVVNIFDPKENIEAGTHYLSDLLKRYNNDLVLALAAYNAGPERVEQFGRVPPYNETISYVRRVKKTYEKNKSAQPELSLPKTSPKMQETGSTPPQNPQRNPAPAPGNSPATNPN